MMADDLFVIDVELFLNHFFMFFETFFCIALLRGVGCGQPCGIVESIIKAV